MKKTFILIIISFLSCTKEQISTTNSTEFEFYVEEFILEAQKRGFDFSIEHLNLKFGNLEGAAGNCDRRKSIITIDSVKWQRRDSFQKLFLIYHELGHCLSHKIHKSTFLPNGECQSIMRTGSTDCSLNIYSKRWRRYYLDELFGIADTYPEWYFDDISYNNAHNKTEIFRAEKISISLFQQNFAFLTDKDYEIEITSSFSSDFNSSLFTLWGNITISNRPDGSVTLRNQKEGFEYYSNKKLPIKDTMKITFRQFGEWQYLFFDESYVHKMDKVYLENYILSFHSFESEKINIDIKINLFE